MRIQEQRQCQLAHDATTTTAVVPNLKKLVLASPVGFEPLPSRNERISPSNVPPALRLLGVL